ncbi:hypothetical protein N8I77_012251 [Diaporthe amygdali]|uniref:Uncharacterized protein n=1 Tax=Phomopsis amygdali TaxID=1214568 RepID=A0AAD9S5R8_PHOAM|nr:hypothetical protein N8I77_012251 [Diaporthe amygdali]
MPPITYTRRSDRGSAGEHVPLLGNNHSDEVKLQAADGSASAFAIFGLAFTIMWIQALLRWFASPSEFLPAPILGPDEISPWRLIALHIFEGLNMAVLLTMIWFCLLVPLFPYLRSFKKTSEPGRFTLDGRQVLGGLVAFCADGFLNCQQYIFMWNSHGVNRGVWVRFLPFHSASGPTRYAENLLFGPPMYVYFCEGFGILGCAMAKPIRRFLPGLTNASLLTIVWCIEFAADFVIENAAIRMTHAYGYAKTYGPLPLFPGKVHQFPLYESVFVASLGVLHTAIRMKWLDNGISPVERGFDAWHPRLHNAVRTFAVFGFCAAAVIMFYHLPLNWLGVIGDCYADMPSYMKAGYST